MQANCFALRPGPGLGPRLRPRLRLRLRLVHVTGAEVGIGAEAGVGAGAGVKWGWACQTLVSEVIIDVWCCV